MPAGPVKFTIDVTIEPRYRRWVAAALLRSAAQVALRQQGASGPAALSVLVTNDAALQALNRDFLAQDRPTDVLAFPSGEIDPETGRLYLGDIALSYPSASRQARGAGHPVRAELQLLVVHGVLHLLGHDHGTTGDQTRMWAEQAAILAKLGAPITGPIEPRPRG